ncbi:MAG: hypothetical protein QW622_00455 [Candidatus Pacearchaeota archaeon]
MKEKNQEELINKEKIILVLLFLLALTFFLWLHSTHIGWDFQTYVLNAKYWFADGDYFEWARPPLVPLLLGIFSFFGWKASEYVFIIFVTFLHFLSCIVFAKRFKINKVLFYAISLSPFVLITGLSEGTELLSLALLQLFLAFIETNFASFFLGLAFLARYPNLIFTPLLLFTLIRDRKKFLPNIFFFLLVISPWLLFNFLTTGNAFTSIMDSYALNIKFRGYINQPFNIKDFILITNYLLPFFIVGIIRRKGTKFKAEDWLMIVFFVLALFSYSRIPIKLTRYLFVALLPIFYLSSIAIEETKKKSVIVFVLLSSSLFFFVLSLLIYINPLNYFKYLLIAILPILITSYFLSIIIKKIGHVKVFLLLLLLLSFSFAILIYFTEIKNPIMQEKSYLDIVNETKDFLNCGLSSNIHIQLNYFGIKSEGAPLKKEMIKKKLEDGYRILFFKIIPEPDYIKNETFLHQFPIIKEGKNYVLLGDKTRCALIRKINQTYLESISELYRVVYNENFSISFYDLFFTNKTA